MKTTVLARILALLLMLCMLVSVFAACATEDEEGSGNPEESTVATGGDGSDEVGADTDEKGYLKDNLPKDLKIDREIRILYSQKHKDWICVDEEGSAAGVVEKAIYDRWQDVQDRLGVEVLWIAEPGQWNNTKDTFIQKVETNSNTGTAFDAVASYNLFPGALANKGLLENLADTEYIELEQPWWPKSYIDEMMVNDTIYGLVENSSRATLCNLHGTFFNNTLINAHGLTSPYDMVANNTWTFDNMMAMIKDIGSDLNSNGTKDKDDYFGLVTGTKAKIETWFFGMGYRYSQKTADGGIELLMGNSDKMIEWIDRFNDATSGKDFLIYDENGHTKAFKEDRAVLYMSSIQLVDSLIKAEMKMDYGVVPVPKGSDSQERYISNVANDHNAWSVPINCKDLDESSAVVECMASEAYRTIAPMYFETCIKLRYAPDERLFEMYDLIRDSITFDFCQVYSFVFASGSDPRALIQNCTSVGTANWASQWGSVGSNVENGFADILTLYGLG